MTENLTRSFSSSIRKFISLLIFMGISWICTGQTLKLELARDEGSGYTVNIYDRNTLLVADTGEFSLFMSNADYSVREKINAWRGSKVQVTGDTITLQKDSYLENFDANLSVKVTYALINPHVIKKTVSLYQPSMPVIYYILSETTCPGEKPEAYVTFEHDSFPGGQVHELFTSAGFITPGNMVVGILTDPGYNNQYTRTTRRRFGGRGGGMTGMRKLPDSELYRVASPEEQAQGKDYIRQTFGMMADLDRGSGIDYPLPVDIIPEGHLNIHRADRLLEMEYQDDNKAGINWMTPMSDQKIYTISFQARGDVPVALKLYRMHDGYITTELEHGLKYIDHFPVVPDKWTEFKGSIMVPYINHDQVMMFLGKIDGQKGAVQVKDIRITENRPVYEPYNRLMLGEPSEKVTYYFIEPWTTHHDFMVSSQTRLAEGMGCKGSDIEKILYTDFQLNTWITSIDDFTPFNVPNMNYSPDMYNRDSFWSVISTYNKRLNLAIWNQWAKTQTPQGGIGTIITPYMGSVEAKDNEATIEWLIWAVLNQRRFGYEPPAANIARAAHYVLHTFDADNDAICRSHFSMSQIDIMDYPSGTDRLCANQGMFAIGLRTIKELGFPVDDGYLAKAEAAYRNFYDPQQKHLLFDRNYPDIITLTDLVPEFLSLWLFDHPILTDEMVINHLDQIPALNKRRDAPFPQLGTTAPICVRLTHDKRKFSYLSPDYQPFGEFGRVNYAGHARDGYYYNGGSWLRAEYCAYVTGMKHGWKDAEKRMANRLWAEVHLNPDMPYSKEFIPTHYTTTSSWWKSTRGLGWNIFVLMANEFAGLRTPDMDPDYGK